MTGLVQNQSGTMTLEGKGRRGRRGRRIALVADQKASNVASAKKTISWESYNGPKIWPRSKEGGGW